MAKPSVKWPQGVSWVPGEQGWVPRFVHGQSRLEGNPRPAKAFLPGEPFHVSMEFANLIAMRIFGVGPFHEVEEEGEILFKSNPAFEEIPTIVSMIGGFKAPETDRGEAQAEPVGSGVRVEPSTAIPYKLKPGQAPPADQIQPD